MNQQDAEKEIWDVIVVGGGPAGMMAAATAARAGARVLLLEKNDRLGKKLSITGGGRCNVTNNKPEVRTMLAQYREEGKFLFSTFTQHGVAESIDWFLERGVPVVEENEGRLFPDTHSAETICAALEAELKAAKVTVLSQCEATALTAGDVEQVFAITTKHATYVGKRCVLATGGYARPDTGSTGDGFAWLAAVGHTIQKPDTALVPIALKTQWTKALSGLTLPDVKVHVWSDGKKWLSDRGRVLFTHVGVSAPLILNMSKQVGDLLPYSPVELRLDVFPEHDPGALKDFFHELLQSNKMLQNALAEVLPLQFVKGVLSELKINGETPCHSVRSEDRSRLRQYLKAVPLQVDHLMGADKAIVSSGGVGLPEIDFKTMESKLLPGLFVVGDLLNINRPSGGYSLQLCWSTGFVAGQAAAL